MSSSASTRSAAQFKAAAYHDPKNWDQVADVATPEDPGHLSRASRARQRVSHGTRSRPSRSRALLYLLADGNAPQWCAVRNHNYVRNVVALMVPGLEMGMFDGKIPLSEPEEQDKQRHQPLA